MAEKVKITLERVKPTEQAILDMVRIHYSHRDNVEKRPRTKKTSKTWWSNARLVVFSDPEAHVGIRVAVYHISRRAGGNSSLGSESSLYLCER